MKASRRTFLAASGGLFSVNALAGQLSEGAGPPAPASWPERRVETDVLVAGGGLAGVCAALAAARNGAKVVLVQNRSRLGGNSSSEIRMHVCGANNSKALTLWRETGIIEELKLTDAATNLQRSFEMWDLTLYDKVLSEPNITLMLDTMVVEATLEKDLITAATAWCPMTAERVVIQARFFLDCTGDSVLADAAGAKYVRGREGRGQYGESLAPEQADDKTMGNSLLFMARQHDRPMPFKAPAWARKFTKEDFKHRAIRSWEYGYWWIEWGGELDTIKDNQRIRQELMRILMGVWDYIKNSGEHPASENWALDWVGMIPGKRENRRIVGDHVMVQKELESAEAYPDRVSYGGWPMDDHPPGGMDSRDIPPCTQIHLDNPYSIPLRSLYSVNRPNLLMAGRNLSASHVALTSTRVMATCAAMGQAAGTAAAFCVQQQCLPKNVAAVPGLMQQLQQRLLRDDQSLLGVVNEDLEDLARTAKVSCSHQTKDGAAEQVIDGLNRDVGDGKTHQWRADMAAGEPWLQLAWDGAKKLRTIQLTFDTALHRKLFLSGEDGAYLSQTRGIQPETVTDYVIEAQNAGAWRAVAHVQGNYLRCVRHTFEPVETTAVRLRVLKTGGDTQARIFEIRCYA